MECGGEPTCLSCVSGGSTESVTECLEKYHPDDGVSDGAGAEEEEGEASYCRSLASLYCCGSYDMYYTEGVVCVDEELVVEYWVRASLLRDLVV